MISNPALARDFRYHIKQRGGMFAKGRLLGIQFQSLMTGGLYEAMAEHAVDLAMILRRAFTDKGYALRYDSPTNQQFPILPEAHLAVLEKKYEFSVGAAWMRDTGRAGLHQLGHGSRRCGGTD